MKNFLKFEKDDLIEVQYRDRNDIEKSGNKPHVVGDFEFFKDEIVISHVNSFRKWKWIKFPFPLLIDLPVEENVNINEVYDVIGEALKRDFIKFLRENKPK